MFIECLLFSHWHKFRPTAHAHYVNLTNTYDDHFQTTLDMTTSESKWTCRDAVVTDAESIWNIHTDCINMLCSSHYSQQQIESWAERQRPERYAKLIQRDDDFVVIEDSTQTPPQVVGFGHQGQCSDPRFSPNVDFEIYGFYISPSVKRQGAGRALLAELKKRALSQRGTRLGACSTLNAIPFYEACGFTVMKESVHSPGELDLSCKILEQDIDCSCKQNQ